MPNEPIINDIEDFLEDESVCPLCGGSEVVEVGEFDNWKTIPCECQIEGVFE